MNIGTQVTIKHQPEYGECNVTGIEFTDMWFYRWAEKFPVIVYIVVDIPTKKLYDQRYHLENLETYNVAQS